MPYTAKLCIFIEIQWSRQRFRHGIYPLITFTPTSVTLGVGYKGGYPSHPFFRFDWKTLTAKDVIPVCTEPSATTEMQRLSPSLLHRLPFLALSEFVLLLLPGWAFILVPPCTFQALDFTHIFYRSKPILCNVCYSFCLRVEFFSNSDLVSRKQKEQR